jgi:hypothetical protein
MVVGKYARHISEVQEKAAANRGTSHMHEWHKFPCCVLKEKCLGGKVQNIVRDLKDLMELWQTLDVCNSTIGQSLL